MYCPLHLPTPLNPFYAERMSLPHLSFLVLDTETTGFVPKTHRVIEFACVKIEGGKKTAEVDQLLSISATNDIPLAIQRLTHITPQDLTGKPTFAELLPSLESLLSPETIIVGQNVQFDLGMLKGEGWDLTERPWIDTSMLASLVFPELQSYSLGFMSDALGLDHTPRHRALGDVRATLQLLEKCAGRLSELPETSLEKLRSIAGRAPTAYRTFFEALPRSVAVAVPSWLASHTRKSSALAPLPQAGFTAREIRVSEPMTSVSLQEEPLNPEFLAERIQSLLPHEWFAVKNVESAVRRYDIPPSVTVLYPPEFLLSEEKAKALLRQKSLTNDEMTIAMKLSLYSVSTRVDLPLHGGEYQVWAGKLACTVESPEYRERLARALHSSTLVSHHQLLTLASSPDFVFPSDLSLTIDDASMLEDTATTAFGWMCSIPTIRAASQGDPLLMQCVDTIELWAERVRDGLDLRYLTESDVSARDATITRLIDDVLKRDVPSAIRSALQDLRLILDPSNLAGRITWIEAYQDGSKTIKSVPESVSLLLQNQLFSRVQTTLLIPPKSADSLQQILGHSTADIIPSDDPLVHPLTITLPIGENLESIFRTPIGKTVLLVSSKRVIEDVYVKYGPIVEAEGVTLICQGFNGGQGRMQAEFELASAPAFIVMTPWMYEGMELREGTVDRFILQTLPFDHPSHAVVSRRSLRLKDPFNEYSLPRLKHRLFRLLRTFARHASTEATALIVDDRLRTKAYGKGVSAYLLGLGSGLGKEVEEKKEQKKTAPKKSEEKEQMKLL